MIQGSSSDVLSVITSLDVNFNQYGYVLTTNSPATNSNYTPNPSYPNWIFDVWYEIEVKLSAFGSAGFGKVGITGVHASPSKTGNNTETVTEGPCCEVAARITGDSILCTGESTTLSVEVNKSLTLNVIDDVEIWNTTDGLTKNYGACNILYINGSPLQRDLIRFNTSSIPSNAEIVSANLIMTKVGGNSDGTNVSVHRVTNDWTEGTGSCSGTSGTANWVKRTTSSNWSSQGGDFVSQAEANVNVGGNGTYNWNITDLVGGWRNGTFSNFGLMLKFTTENVNKEMNFASAEYSTSSSRPYISVNYFDGQPTGGNVQYRWNTGATTASINVSPTVTTTYTVTITGAEGCNGVRSITVSVNPKPVATTGDDPNICTGQQVLLTANGSNGTPPYTFQWNNPTSSGSSKTVSPTTTTTYTVTVTDAKGCKGTDQVTVNVDSPPVAAASNNGPLSCIKTQVTLTAEPATGVTYLWSNGATTRTTLVSTPGTYTVTVTKTSSDCFAIASTTVSGDTQVPVIDAGPDVTINCLFSSANLNAVSNTNILWSTGQTTPNITVTPLTTTTYTVTATASNGCTASDAVTVFVEKTPPNANAGPDVTVNCFTANATLTATGGGSYVWSTGATTAVIIVSPLVTTTYTVTVTGTNGCTATDQVTVTANKTQPLAGVSANGNNCLTQNAQLFGTASGGLPPYSYSYTGPNGFTSTQQNPFISQNGTYTLIVTDSNGCTDDINIVIFSEFTPFVITVTTEICAGESVVLNASGGVSFQWSPNANNATTSSVTVTPQNTSTYTVTITNENGCTGIADATITVYNIPVITNIQTTPNPSCNNTNNNGTITIQASGTPGLTKQYRLNGGVWQTSNVFTNLANGTYNAEVSYTTRLCLSPPVQAIITSAPGPVAVAENDKSVCAGGTFTLSASASNGTLPYTFVWSNGMTGNPISIPGIMAPTSYTVTVTDALGCTGTDIVNISIIPGPTSGINGPTTVCANESVLFTAIPAGPGTTYSWVFDGGTPATASGPSASASWATPGEYAITLNIMKNGCPNTYEAYIIITESVFAAAGPNAEICQGGNITCKGTALQVLILAGQFYQEIRRLLITEGLPLLYWCHHWLQLPIS
jgi:hypothetical protein